MSISLDVQWPWVFSRFDGEQSIDELEAYIQRMTREVHGRRLPYFGISYMKRYNRDSAQVDRIRRWMKESEEATREHCVATGIISASSGFRFLLGAIFLVQRMPVPYKVCATFDEAVAFVRTKARTGMAAVEPRRPWGDLP
jgi:hypothetical protein